MNQPLILNRATVSVWSTTNTGMVFMALAMLLLPVSDTFAKILTGVMGPVEVTMWRLLAQGLCLLPIVVLLRRRLRGAMFSPVVALSGLLVMITLTSLVTAFSVMPIATAIAIFFVEPLLLTLLAGPFLGEVPGWRRYAAVGVGLIGALVVIRPNFATFGPVVLLPLLAALAYAMNMIVMRKSTRTRSALSFQFGASMIAGGLSLLAVLLAQGLDIDTTGLATLPEWGPWALASAGALALVTFMMITFAFSKVEASLLAPFQYLEIVGATAVGYLFFNEVPDGMTLFGTAIILTSGAYVFYRERVRGVDGAATRPSER